jgi:hypothetical protein
MSYCAICPTGMYQQIEEIRAFAADRLGAPLREERA